MVVEVRTGGINPGSEKKHALQIYNELFNYFPEKHVIVWLNI